MNAELDQTTSDEGSTAVRVELRAGRLPMLGRFACHHWFVIEKDGCRDRWEIWQRAEAGGVAWGHLHKNLWSPDRGVGLGASWVVRAWQGDAARALMARIESSPSIYPAKNRYHFWPGPNSNSYCQWVVGDAMSLGWTAPGAAFARSRLTR